ncbi:hypothetical protein B8W95_13230, partial [Staphylococcus pasteuri]
MQPKVVAPVFAVIAPHAFVHRGNVALHVLESLFLLARPRTGHRDRRAVLLAQGVGGGAGGTLRRRRSAFVVGGKGQ